MSILFNTGVVNVKGSPSIITDTFANRPQATSMQMGTIFFSTDTFNIFQVVPFGITQAWATMGGGGGGTQNLDNVLYQGGTFTNDRLSNLGGYGWELYNFNYFELQNINNQLWRFTDTSLKYYNSTNTNTFFSLNYTTGEFAMGDFGGTINGTHMNIDVANSRIYFAPNGYMSFLNEQGKCTLGDGFNLSNGLKFIADVNTQSIFSNIGGVDNGISIQRDAITNVNTCKFGDFEGQLDGGFIQFDNTGFFTQTTSGLMGIYFAVQDQVSIGWFNGDGGFMRFNYSGGILPCSADTFMLNQFGLRINESDDEDSGVQIGDYTGVTTNCHLFVRTQTQRLQWIDFSYWDITGTALLTTSSGSTSGYHLKVNVGGNNYVIELKNP